MARIGLLLITLINIAGLFISSIMAAAGSGSVKTGWQVFGFGGLWIFIFAYISWTMLARGKKTTGFVIALMTWPAASILGMGLKWGGLVASDLKSNSPEFELACKSVGAKYLNKPSLPVRTIAYDWEGSRSPGLNVIRIASSGRIESSGYVMPRFGSAIEFTEGRCCEHVGRPLNGVGPYVRRPNNNSGEYFGVTDLSADVLVNYKISKINTSNEAVNLGQVDITITDRRDSKELASFRYISDGVNKKLCGTTSEGVMDETAFVQKALGLN